MPDKEGADPKARETSPADYIPLLSCAALARQTLIKVKQQGRQLNKYVQQFQDTAGQLTDDVALGPVMECYLFRAGLSSYLYRSTVQDPSTGMPFEELAALLAFT